MRPIIPAKHIPYNGEVRIVVTTAEPREGVVNIDGRPSFLVARTDKGSPRAAFVAKVIEDLYGSQLNGSPHEWCTVETANLSATATVK